MAFELQEIRDSVKLLTQDDAPFITDTERENAITQAIRQVSNDRPDKVVKDISGDGTNDYDMPTEFQKGFSDIESVETPTGDNPPTFRDRDDDFFVYEDPTKSPVLRLRFKLTIPSATDTIRVIISSPHSVTLTTSTLNQSTFLATVYKAAQLIFLGLAARFGQTTDPTIAADAVDYGGRTQNFLFMADQLLKAYNAIIGLGDQDVKAALAMGEFDIKTVFREDYLFHPARRR